MVDVSGSILPAAEGRPGGLMLISLKRKKRVTVVLPFSLAATAFAIVLPAFTGIPQATGQDAHELTRTVTITSTPPGGTIWKKEGRDYTCMNTVTLGNVELAFHDANDLQRLRVRKFGYTKVNLDVKATDRGLAVELNPKGYRASFLVAGATAMDYGDLNDALKVEFEKTILNDPEAFRCAPFDLEFIHLTEDEETKAPVLNVVVRLDRSVVGPEFRMASHAANPQERHQRMGQAALEGGIAEVFGRFRRLAVKFPDLKSISVLCMYSTSEAVLDTERTFHTKSTETPLYELGPGKGQTGTEYRTTSWWEQNDVVKDQAAERAITIVVPADQIPDTMDKKAISEAVLAAGKVILAQ